MSEPASYVNDGKDAAPQAVIGEVSGSDSAVSGQAPAASASRWPEALVFTAAFLSLAVCAWADTRRKK